MTNNWNKYLWVVFLAAQYAFGLEKSVFLDQLSWTQAETVFKEKPIAIIPVAPSLKEHGHHLLLGNDLQMTEILKKKLFEKVKAVFLPTLPYGYYPGFDEYPGSVSIRQELFRDTLIDIGKSLHKHGIDRIYILNLSVSTNKPLEDVKNELKKDGIVFGYLDLTTKEVVTLEKKTLGQARGSHADEFETSIMLYLDPTQVDMSKAKREMNIMRATGGLTRNSKSLTGIYSESGVWGDPTLATKEKGKILADGLIDLITKQLESLK